MQLKNRKYFTLFIVLISLTLLIPGILLPVMSFKAEINKQGIIKQSKQFLKTQGLPSPVVNIAENLLNNIEVEGTITLVDKTRSIVGTFSDLWVQGYYLVAILIILFSTIIPSLKLVILTVSCFVPSKKMINFNAFISKWSMADVFAIALFIAFVAISASKNNSELVHFETHLHQGFYWFLGFCLFSIAAGIQIQKQQQLK